MSEFKLSARSLERLQGVHADLVACVKKAITLSTVDFTVSEGVRSLARQKELFNGSPKKTWTMKSKHLRQADGVAHAVDLVPIVDGKCAWDRCDEVASAMYQAATQLDIAIRWGGDWNQNGSSDDEHHRGVYDGPHFELC